MFPHSAGCVPGADSYLWYRHGARRDCFRTLPTWPSRWSRYRPQARGSSASKGGDVWTVDQFGVWWPGVPYRRVVRAVPVGMGVMQSGPEAAVTHRAHILRDEVASRGVAVFPQTGPVQSASRTRRWCAVSRSARSQTKPSGASGCTLHRPPTVMPTSGPGLLPEPRGGRRSPTPHMPSRPAERNRTGAPAPYAPEPPSQADEKRGRRIPCRHGVAARRAACAGAREGRGRLCGEEAAVRMPRTVWIGAISFVLATCPNEAGGRPASSIHTGSWVRGVRRTARGHLQRSNRRRGECPSWRRRR